MLRGRVRVAEAAPEVAGRLEDARADAVASLARTQRGPAIVPIREGAGQ
jgi:hypothetical protein